MEKEELEAFIGQGLGPRRMDYTWRDVVLYALGVGAHKEDLIYTFEKKGLKALPSFGLIPYLNSITMNPLRRVPYTPATLVKDYIINKMDGKSPSGLHMDMDLEMKGTIDPMKGSFLCEDKVRDIYDRGEGKGIAVEAQMDVYDIAGNPICTCKSTHAIFAFGGYGGKKAPSKKVIFPDRTPDFTFSDHMDDTQALLYRLSGDTYDVHVDEEVAKGHGFKGPFMQGLCTFGFACRMGIQTIIPNQPERLTHLYAQMRSLCYPGTDVRFEGWLVEEGKVYFRLFNDEGKTVLDYGVFEFK